MAGTVESSDIQIMISPKEEPGIELVLESSVLGQYGNQIAWNGCGGGRNLVVRIGTSAPYPLSLYRIKLSVEKAGRT